MKTMKFLQIALALVLVVSAIGCSASTTPEVVETNIPTEQAVDAYEAEMNSDDPIEE